MAELVTERGVIRSAVETIVFLVAAWIGLAAPFLLPVFLALPVSAVTGAFVLWRLHSKRTWIGDDASRFFFVLGALVVGQLTFRPLGGVPLSDVLFLTSLALALVLIATHRQVRARRPPPLLLAPAAAVIVGGMIAAGASSTPGPVVAATGRVVFVIAVLPWLALQTLRTEQHLIAAVLAWTISIAASGAAALLQIVDGRVIPGTAATWGRMTGFTQHVNDLGGETAVALLPAVAVVALLPKSGTGRALWILPALVLSGLILSLSLSAIAALLVGLAALGITAFLSMVRPRRSRRVVTRIAVASVLGVVALAAIPPLAGAPSIVDRLATTTNPESPLQKGTLWTRWQTIKDAWPLVREHPITGVGADPDDLVVGFESRRVHNTPLATWASMGAIAMIGVVCAFIASLVAAGTAARRAPPPLAYLAYALFGGFVAYCAFALVSPALYRRYGWIAVALAVVIGRLHSANEPWARGSA